MKKLTSFLLLSIIFFNLQVSQIGASSAGDEGTPPPPPPSTGSSAGGSPQFFDYYVPLVFNSSHPHQQSEIVVWIIQPGLLITSFSLDSAGSNQIQVQSPRKFVFNPVDNRGLTNGSLIRTTSPALVIGQRMTEDIFSDYSFAYSILSSRMMGFEYIAPFDGWISLITNTPNTIINVKNPSEYSRPWLFPLGQSTITIPVMEGATINSSYPTSAAFISFDYGVSATMAVPGYLRGSNYMFDSNITAPRPEEIDQSFISINPEEPTELEFTFLDGSTVKKPIFGPTKLALNHALRGINSSRGKIEVNFRIRYEYGGLIRSGSLQLIAAPEMRAGEVFATPSEYSSNLISINNDTKFITGIYNKQEDGFGLSARHVYNRSAFETFSYNGIDDSQLIFGDNSAFGFLSSPGKVGHPMSPSLIFLNIPLNAQTSKENVTSILATWYRFPNLAVKRIEVFPSPYEEYTGQTIVIEIISNASLPASRFKVEIIIDEQNVVEETYDFLQVNDTLVFEFRRFIGYGKTMMNISVNVDVDNEVNEINEDDNSLDYGIEVNKNIRVRWSLYGSIILMIIYISYKIRSKIINLRRSTRSRVDAIISFEEVEE